MVILSTLSKVVVTPTTGSPDSGHGVLQDGFPMVLKVPSLRGLNQRCGNEAIMRITTFDVF